MLYAILGYASEDDVCARTREEDDAVAASLGTLFGRLTEERRLGPVAQLLPTTAATTIRTCVVLPGTAPASSAHLSTRPSNSRRSSLGQARPREPSS